MNQIRRRVNLHPVMRRLLGRSVLRLLPLRHDALKVEFADLLEELIAARRVRGYASPTDVTGGGL
jgi:hypothetical protein